MTLQHSHSLARVLRPQKFHQVLGQKHTIASILSRLKEGSFPQTALLSGTRGCGKTTTARLIGKALSCENLQEGEPCGECSSCKKIQQNRTPDLCEFDAASFTGVDHIKNLIDLAQLSPSHLKRKIFILDEVHMLSQSSFNALLKTLEEPPQHSYFLLATTEIHKIPMTVLSRCHLFPFQAFEAQEMEQALQKILKQFFPQVTLSAELLKALARESEGSLRDALNLLESLNLKDSNPKVFNLSDFQIHQVKPEQAALTLFQKLDQNQWTSLLSHLDECEKKNLSWKELLKYLQKWIHQAFLWQMSKNHEDPYFQQTFPPSHPFRDQPPQESFLTFSDWFRLIQEIQFLPHLTKDLLSLQLSLALHRQMWRRPFPLSKAPSPLLTTNQAQALPQKKSTSHVPVQPIDTFFQTLEKAKPFLASKLKNLKFENKADTLIFQPCEKGLFDQITEEDEKILKQVQKELTWPQHIQGLTLKNKALSWKERQKKEEHEQLEQKRKKLEQKESYQLLTKEFENLNWELHHD